MLVCNKKAQAKAVYDAVLAQQNGSANIMHLSTSMCMAHRIRVMRKVKSALKKDESIILVSTQLVEAGVDFSFACAIRVVAGLDNIIQVAGRCNRSGEKGRRCPVYIVNMFGEDLVHLEEIKQSQLAAEAVLDHFVKKPEDLDGDLSSNASIRAYYRRLYADMAQDGQDYPLKKLNTNIYTLLSDNIPSWEHCPHKPQYVIAQAFKTAGSTFKVFDDDTVDVLVPYGYGSKLIADLGSQWAKWDFNFRRKKLKEAKRFSISLFDYEMKAIEKLGGITSYWEKAVFVLEPHFYSENTGYSRVGDGDWFKEV